ncbi:MAG: response regulator transcription factor [Bacteroidota bacterium]
MKPHRRILLLEDDANLGFILKEHLEMNGFAVTLCANGVEGLAEFRKQKISMCLVDVMMPKKDGFSFVKEIRGHDQKTPVIFLTAKSLKEDRIEGLKIGADDYITKPFSMEELLLRISAVLKRSSPMELSDKPQNEFKIGTFRFDVRKSLLLANKKKPITLTSKEAELLAFLCAAMNTVIERERILNSVWTNDSYYSARSMDVYLSKLRKYLKSDPKISIINVRGKGFKLLVDE